MNRFPRANRLFKSCPLASAGLAVLAVTLSSTAQGRVFAQRAQEDSARV